MDSKQVLELGHHESTNSSLHEIKSEFMSVFDELLQERLHQFNIIVPELVV